MYVIRAFIALFAILLGTISAAQDATNSMTFTIDGTELELLASPAFERSPSYWEIVSGADNVHNVDIIGNLLIDGAIEQKVRLSFGIWDLPEGVRVEQPFFQMTERGDAGSWTTIDQRQIDGFDLSKMATVVLSRYERTDAGMLLEGTFAGNPDYWPTEFKKPEARGPFVAANGDFSIFFPAPEPND